MIQSSEASLFMRSAKEYTQIKILDRPKKRLDAMIDLRTEILELCDVFYVKVKAVTDRIMSEVHDPEHDEGLIEVKIHKYMECFNIDLSALDDLLCEEIKIKQDDLRRAEKAAQNLIHEMNHILRVNDDALKVFLEDSKYKVEFLSKAKPLRPLVKREEFRDRAF